MTWAPLLTPPLAALAGGIAAKSSREVVAESAARVFFDIASMVGPDLIGDGRMAAAQVVPPFVLLHRKSPTTHVPP